MDASHYLEVQTFLRSRTAKPNWTAEQRQFYQRAYGVDKMGNLLDARTGDRVQQLDEYDQGPPGCISRAETNRRLNVAVDATPRREQQNQYKYGGIVTATNGLSAKEMSALTPTEREQYRGTSATSDFERNRIYVKALTKR